MPKIKMRETRDVAPDGINIEQWDEGATYDADGDLLDVLLREDAAELVEKKKDPAPPENKGGNILRRKKDK